MLPKIHKNISPPPGRPIISGNGSPTERIFHFVDFFLKDISKLGKSYVKDTTLFLKTIQDITHVPENTILVTLDVKSLYTNIPNELGIKACLQALQKHRRGKQNPSNISIIRLLNMVLTINNFEFNGDHYLQIGGTAMGTRAAPNYAIISMNWFEATFVYTYQPQPLLWVRYIDDIFMLYQHGQHELEKFIKHLNSCHSSIQFTTEQSNEQVSFLDTWVIKNKTQNTLHTDLYVKPTDSHMYLRFDSCHPKHCKESLPYSQYLRIRQICSNLNDFEHSANLTRWFSHRGYPIQCLKQAYLRAKSQDRLSLIQTRITQASDSSQTDNLFAITTYSPGFFEFKSTIKANWDFLSRSKTTRSLHRMPTIFGLRRPPNLRDILVTAKVPQDHQIQKPKWPTPKCDKFDCVYCTDSINQGQSGTITANASIQHVETSPVSAKI